MREQGVGSVERTDPQQTAEAATVQHQMQGLFELQGHVRQPFEGEKVGTAGLGMAAVAEPFELTLLGRAKAPGASGEVGLLQRPSSQAPADLRPRARPGNRVR